MSKASRARKAAASNGEGSGEETPEAETPEEATPELVDVSGEDGGPEPTE